MAGQIVKRGEKTWIVRIFQGRDENGKRRYVNKTIHGTKKSAEKYLTAKLRDKDLGINIEPASESLDKYLEKWLESVVRSRVREATFDDYKYLLDRYVSPSLGAIKLCDIRSIDIQKVYGDMLGEKELSARTVRMTHAVLSSAMKQAVRWHMLPRNPCEFVDLPRMARKEMQALSPEDASRFLEAAREDKLGIVLSFALATGMRPEEYLALKWSDLDLHAGNVTVRRTLVWRKGGGWYFGEPKTSRSRRTMPIPRSLVAELADHRRKQAESRLKKGADYQNNDLLFASGEGTPILLRNLVRRHFQPLLTRAKLSPTLRLYDLRHSCATLLLSAGENPKVVSERLGHASIVLTLDTYSHVLPSMQQAATEKLERILYG
jgi:integrase